MPQMGLEVTEGTIAEIRVAVGDDVNRDDPLLDVETDKALTEVVAPSAGQVLRIDVQVGETVAIGQTLVVLGGEAEAGEPVPRDEGGSEAGERLLPGDAAAGERLRAAPIARRAAERLGIPLSQVSGSGPRGRVTLEDVERAAAQRSANGAIGAGPSTEQLQALGSVRATVARRMTVSQQIPQYPLTRELDATWLLSEKERLSQTTSELSVNDLLIRALAETAVAHRDLAAVYVDDGGAPHLRRRADIDIGLAVATDRGLVVPVLRRVQARSLRELAAERLRLVQAARSGKLRREDTGDASLTLSSLAAFGVDSFAAMLNPGETAILAVGRAVDRVVPRARGLAVVPTLILTLTVDHRVMDGAAGGQALTYLAGLLEGDMAWRT
jgi:pyruvate dehydrogenase E2 component (dihydrolipoamide acetyltransferase)